MTKLLDRIGIFIPMLVGAYMGYMVQRYMGVAGIVGMSCGAAVWVAWELRLQARRDKVFWDQLEEDRKMISDHVIGRVLRKEPLQ